MRVEFSSDHPYILTVNQAAFAGVGISACESLPLASRSVCACAAAVPVMRIPALAACVAPPYEATAVAQDTWWHELPCPSRSIAY